jgi:Uma2 family endonuclease
MRFVKAAERRVSYAELQQWPDDGHQYELYDGEAIMVPAPVTRHQRVVGHVADILRDYEEATGGFSLFAPLDIVFDEYNVVQPDVVFFCHARRHLLDQWGPSRIAPDLAVEVLSPSTQVRDRGRKMELLARFGVPEYWIVDPKTNTLEIFVLRGGAFELAIAAGEHETIVSPTLANLSFEADRVFAE